MGTFQGWLLTLVETRRSATTFWPWVLMIIIVNSLLAFAAYVEPISLWFHLDFPIAVLCFVPMMLLGLVAGWAESKNKLPLPWFGALILLGSLFFQFFWAALVMMSSLPGSFVMAAMFLITVITHGYLHRVSKQYPYGLVATGISVSLAHILWPESESTALLYFCGATGGLLSMITGGIGLRLHENLVAQDRLKQALYYRELNEKAREHTEMSRRVFDLLKYNHDAGNTLSTIFVHAQLLEERLAGELHEPKLVAVGSSVATLVTQLQRLKTLINSAHRIADELPVVEIASLSSLLPEIVHEIQAMFPAVQISYVPHLTAPCVQILDGDVGLRRVIENVLRNACEGDGTTSANNVVVQVHVSDTEVCLSVSDDGPGFGDTMLIEPPAALVTTKSYGHGLGLHNVHELVTASGGLLARANAAVGGAVVSVTLKLAETERDSLPLEEMPLPAILGAPVQVEVAGE